MKVKLSEITNLIAEPVSKFKNKKLYIATGSLDNYGNISGEYVQYEKRPSRANLLVKTNDVCFARMKDTKKVLLINETNSNFIYSTGFAILRPDIYKILPAYLFYLINSESFQMKKNLMTTGATQKAITNEKIKSISINLPTIEEQERVIRLLDTARIFLHKREINSSNINSLSSSIFNKFFGELSTNSKRWPVVEFGKVIDELTDYHANGSYKILKKNVKLSNKPDYALMLRTTDLENDNFKDNVKYISKHAYNFLKKSKVFGGEIVINKIGSAGNVYLVPKFSIPVSLGMNSFLIRIGEKAESKFIYKLLKTNFMRKNILSKVRGAVTKTITKDAIRNLKIIYPPIDLQKRYIKILDKLNELKSLFSKSEIKIKVLKNFIEIKFFKIN